MNSEEIRIQKRKILNFLESYDRLDVMCVRKHIDRCDVGHAIFFWLEEKSEISDECGRIAAHIDDHFRIEGEDILRSRRMHTISWRIDHDDVGFFSWFEEDFYEVFDFLIHEFHIGDRILLSISLAIFTRLSDELDRVDTLEIPRHEHTDSTGTRIEIEEDSFACLGSGVFESFFIEELGSVWVCLEEAFWIDFKLESEETLCDRWLSENIHYVTGDDVGPAMILEDAGWHDARVFDSESSDEFADEFFPRLIAFMIAIHTKDEHDFSRKRAFSDDEMSPESIGSFRVIRRKLGRARECVYLLENGIYFFIGEDTVLTVDDAIEGSLFMESEAEFIMDSLFGRDIFSPGKLDFVAIRENFWWSDDRMECCSFYFVADVMKSLANLSFFDRELVRVLDRKPFAATIHLDFWVELFFEWRFFDDIHDLPFDEAWFTSEYSDVDDTLRNSASWDEDLFSFFRSGESLATEDEFFDLDIFEDSIFLHEKMCCKIIIIKKNQGLVFYQARQWSYRWSRLTCEYPHSYVVAA